MHPEDLKKKIINLALEEGFGRAGVASLDPFQSESDRLDRWFEKDYHRHLPYLDPIKLLSPKSLEASSRTALVVFYPYARPKPRHLPIVAFGSMGKPPGRYRILRSNPSLE